MLKIHCDLLILYRKLGLSTMLPLHNFDPLLVMAHRLIRTSAPSYNIADVLSHIHILVYIGIVIIHRRSLSKQWSKNVG